MAIDLVDQDALTALQAENIRLIGLLESHGIPWRMEASGDDRQESGGSHSEGTQCNSGQSRVLRQGTTAAAYALEPLTREERADRAMAVISENFKPKQKVFLDFVLSHYVALGVEELDQAKLTPLLKLKYHDSIPDAVADLGRPDEIGKVFSGFQRYLYV